MYIYLQAYEQGAAVAKPLVAYATFYREQAKVFETQPVSVTPASVAKVGAVPLNFDIGLGQLTPGDYDCQVTILDPTAGKATFWTAPIKIVP